MHASRVESGTREPVLPAPAPARTRRLSPGGWRLHGRPAWTGGGTDGNEQLTAMAGLVLIVLLAVIGLTIVRIGQLISVHLFVGFVLLGPVLRKMASTGYRFARYYSHHLAYRMKGPPELILRLIAPGVVVSTLVVFVSGVLLMIAGPRNRGQLRCSTRSASSCGSPSWAFTCSAI